LESDTVAPYHEAFAHYAEKWERITFADAHAALLAHLQVRPGLVFDVGAGSGRDAAHFAANGWDVVAIEPADNLREHARTLHPSPRIAWENDRLPALEKLLKRGVLADLIWLSAVWMHVAPDDRRRAFRKLVTLLKPGGRLIISLRHGPLPFDRPMHVVTSDEVERLAIEHGLTVRAAVQSEDALGRSDVTWTGIVLELPDDATGALPLVRGVILQDAKAATYKLALLRVIARIADQSASFARYDDDHVELPLGLIAVYWLRMFKRLVEQDIPQAPGHRNRAGLGFVKDAFWSMDVASPFELRPGATFAEQRAHAIVQAVGDAAYTIAKMPATYLKFADKSRIFPTTYAGRFKVRPGMSVTLDASFFWSFGRTRVPLHLWIALRRLSAWIEPMLLAEWTRLIEGYARGQQRTVSLRAINEALRWIDPFRDTAQVRKIVTRLLDSGKTIHCVWSGSRITDIRQIDVDHCFPFAAWPCDDMWNLMPATKRANSQKKDKLITLELLRNSEDRIANWWQLAYRDLKNGERAMRFEEEARASLPVEQALEISSLLRQGLADPAGESFGYLHFIETLPTESILDAMRYQRLRLQQDQQLPEWDGPKS
jgi:SAM-dependent methyltransferase